MPVLIKLSQTSQEKPVASALNLSCRGAYTARDEWPHEKCLEFHFQVKNALNRRLYDIAISSWRKRAGWTAAENNYPEARAPLAQLDRAQDP